MSEQHISLLLVEDSPSDVDFVRASLAESNGVAYSITVVSRLAEAIAHLHLTSVDVVLLDLGLPDSTGLNTLEQLFLQCGGETAVVVMTGNEQGDLGSQAMQLGAQDFLKKKHLTNSNVLLRCIRYAFERKRRELSDRRLAEVQQEFEIARTIQSYLLPKFTPQLPGFEIGATFHPANATGGDFYDFIPLADGRLCIALADVASHGFGPALIMASTRRALRMVAKRNADLGYVLTALNEAVCEDTSPDRFVTLFLACIASETGEFTYAGAGHIAYWFRRDGSVTTLETEGLPLGVLEEGDYASVGPLAFRSGELLLFASDGVFEAHAPFGPPLDAPVVLDYVRENRDRTAEQIVSGLLDSISQFCYPATPHDDVTIVVVKRGSPE